MSGEKQLIPIESQNLIQEALDYLGSIEKITITDDTEYNNVIAMCKDVKKKSKALDKERKSLTDPLFKKQKEIKAEFDVAINKLNSFESASKKAASVYYRKQEQLRIEQQQKLEAEAEERRRKAEEKAKKEQDKVEKYESEGKQHLADKAQSRAEAAQAEAVQTVAPVIETKKVSGTSFKTKFVVDENKVDKEAFVKFCLDNPNYMQYLIIDTKSLNKFAQATKGSIPLPGLNYKEITEMAVRS